MNLTVKTYLQDHSIDLADILENEAKVTKKKKKRGDLLPLPPLERGLFSEPQHWTVFVPINHSKL